VRVLTVFAFIFMSSPSNSPAAPSKVSSDAAITRPAGPDRAFVVE
jgi:hypothetical protein